jgi:nitrate reductase gamma subunit
MILIGLVSLVTIFTMVSRIARVNHLSYQNFLHGSHNNWLQALWDAVAVQSLGQKRYREECEAPENVTVWYLSKWFVHAATMWGFLGLLSATALDFLLDIIGVKATGTFVPLWYPTRLLGTLSGLLFMYGVSVLLYKRWRAADKAHSFSRPSDWIFLTLLWISGVTGFIIEIALYLPGAPQWGYWMFIFHVAVSITLLLLLPFTKFAHAIYRIVALYIHALKPVAKQETAPASAD